MDLFQAAFAPRMDLISVRHAQTKLPVSKRTKRGIGVDAVLRERNRAAVVAHEPSARPNNLEAVRPWCLAGRGDKHTAGRTRNAILATCP